MKHFLTCLLTLILLAACAPSPSALPTHAETTRIPTITATKTPVAATVLPATPTPRASITPTNTLTSTKSSLPSSTPRPTATPLPSPTPYPTLISQGPYLLYSKFDDGPLILTNAAGNNRRVFDLPKDTYLPDLREAASPDREWVVFYTGSYEPPYDLTLNLISLYDGTIIPVVKLLKDPTPENLSSIANFYNQLGYDHEGVSVGNVENILFGYISIRTFDWSPDGRYLAFGGQMDGPSSDLYIYDVEKQHIRRLTNDLRILRHITWSPDGKWLLIANVMMPRDFNWGTTFHVVRSNGSLVLNPPVLLAEDSCGFGLGWISPDLYLITGSPDGGLPYDLRYLNVETGQITDLWSGTFLNYAYDFENKLFVISGGPIFPIEGENGIDDGTYFVTLNGHRQKISNDVYEVFGFREGVVTRFIGIGYKNIAAIAKDGTTTIVEDDITDLGYDYQLSPNKRWFYITGIGSATRLYSATDQFIREFNMSAAVWRDDSSGLIATWEEVLYSIAIPDGEPIQLDQCLPDEKDCRFYKYDIVWLP